MAREKWNWQRDDWGNFTYDTSEIGKLEREFSRQSGFFFGVARHLSREDENDLIVELVSNEAIKTSENEGEFLDRASLQSSIQREFGLGNINYRSVKPAEAGIAEMMKDIFTNYDALLTEKTLCSWH